MLFGPPLVLQEHSEGRAGIDQIFISGPWAARYAGERGPAPRDVDVLLIGEPDRDAAFEAARRAEQRLAREVNVTIRTAERWKTANDGFTTQLRSSPLLEIPLNVAGKRRAPDGGQG